MGASGAAKVAAGPGGVAAGAAGVAPGAASGAIEVAAGGKFENQIGTFEKSKFFYCPNWCLFPFSLITIVMMIMIIS